MFSSAVACPEAAVAILGLLYRTSVCTSRDGLVVPWVEETSGD